MFRRPTTLEGLFDLKAKHNDAKLIVGNTEVGIEMKFKSMAYPHLVGVTHILELNRIDVRLLVCSLFDQPPRGFQHKLMKRVQIGLRVPPPGGCHPLRPGHPD